jgi:UDP-glucose 4-epimerase
LETLVDSTVMVTGGCGFIGSHLVRRLVADGVRRVVVIDGLRYGDVANLGPDLGERVEVVRFTLGIDPPAALAERLRGVDFLFHLAAEKHNQSKDDGEAVLRANVLGTATLFALARYAGVRKTVFTSSLYAYGPMVAPPFVETDVLRPATIYGISKLCGERLLEHHRQASRMAGVVLRYFFVYGPRQFAGMGYRSVIVKNFERILAGERPVIVGDGRQTLDYIFVDDAVDATVLAMAGAPSGETLNVGSGIPTSINELTAAMLAVAESSLEPVHVEPDATAGSYRVAGAARIASVLGWSARTALADGLRTTLGWMQRERAV